MRVTEVRIKLIESSEDRLRGFCSVTFDGCFVVRDLKIIEGNNGPFVAMPSRKLTAHCNQCRSKNHLRAKFCNQCGGRLQSEQIEYDHSGRAKLYADIAHPVNAECREMIQRSVIEALDHETELAAKPGYRPRYDENYEAQLDYESELATAATPAAEPTLAASVDDSPAATETLTTDTAETSSDQSETTTDSDAANQQELEQTEAADRLDKPHDSPIQKHDPPGKTESVEKGPDSESEPPGESFGKGVF